MTNQPEKKGLNDQAQAYRERAEKLTDDLKQTILPLGIALSAEKNLDRLLERILVEVKSICNADAGTLYLRTGDDCLRFAIMRTDSLNIALGGTTGKAIPFAPLRLYDQLTGGPNYHNVATYAALHGHSVNIPDIYYTEDFDFSATKKFDRENGYRTISNLTVPLKNHTNDVIGVLQLLNAQNPTTGQVVYFDSYQQLVVESLASQAAVALNNQLLLQRQQELLKFEHDLHIARQIQIDFLPAMDKLPQIAAWELTARLQPAREVAGDFYDAFSLAGDKVGLVIADVCDKGVGAALFMALSRSLIRAFAKQHGILDRPGDFAARPAEIGALRAVEFTNNYIAKNHGEMGMFVTLFFALLDPATGLLAYINSGHNPPIVVGPTGRVKARLRPTGPIVGVLPDIEFGVRQVTLEPGDLLLAFTDGVLDARDPEGEFFSERRLLSLLEPPAPSATALLDRIEARVQAHIGEADQFDDITLLAVRRVASEA